MKNLIVIAFLILIGSIIWLWIEREDLKKEVDGARTSTQQSVSQASPESTEPPDAVEMLMRGSGSYRTWVIYENDLPNNEHIHIGDAFRILKTGSDRKLIPLTNLRNRWYKDPGFQLDLIKKQPLLCGRLVLEPHPDKVTEHLVVIEANEPDKLEIKYEVYDDTKTLEEQCLPVGGTHAGRAHAEN